MFQPALQHLEQRLAAKGLKDPWIRNEVWRNDVRVFGTPGYRARALLLRAVVPGIAIGAALAAYSYYYKDLRAPRVPYQGDIKRE